MFFICRLPWVLTTILYEYPTGYAIAFAATIHLRTIYSVSSDAAATAAGTAASTNTTEAYRREDI